MEPENQVKEESVDEVVDEELAGDNSGLDEVKSLKDMVADLEDRLLRLAADNQNTRKRLVKQQQDAFKYRHQDILRDLVEVIDNFERAIESSVESRDFDNFHEGILMIEKQFSGMLTEKYSLDRFGSEGDVFDPAAHEAMMVEENSEAVGETVKQLFQAGYRLHDRIIRPAKVVVMKPALNTGEESGAEEANDNEEGAE